MGIATIKNDIEAYLNSNWTATPMTFENVEYTPTGSEFIRVSVLGAAITREIINPTMGLVYDAILVIQIFTPDNVGSGRALRIFDLLFALFSEKRIGGAVFSNPFPQTVGNANGYFQINFRSSFEYRF